MIHGRPRPQISEAIKVESLDKIIRTLHDFPAKDFAAMNGRTVVLFTDGTNVVLVDTSGYGYPRYKTPRIDPGVYDSMNDYALERLLKCKCTNDEVDYVIGGIAAVTK